jgi:hypothetical protein
MHVNHLPTSLIHHQGIISQPRRDLGSGVAFSKGGRQDLPVVVLKDVTQMVFYLFFRYGAEQFVDLFPVLKKNHGGGAHDIVLGCGEGILIYIHLPHFDLACIL